jgi:DNA-binding MurR/RpiR family transcriptional regulator
VKARILPAELGKSLNRAHEVRLLADYSGDPIDILQAVERVRGANAFVLAITALINDRRG